MNKLERQLHEDRRLRNSARALFRREFGHARQEITPAALTGKLTTIAGRKAEAIADSTLTFAESHWRKAAAVGIAALTGTGLWLARKPILSGARRIAGRIVTRGTQAETELGGGPSSDQSEKDANNV